jgi:hypothetical protein
VTIIIHQSIYGEQNKAWDLLKTTMPDTIAARKIAFKTDLQDNPPSGIIWQPVIRGFSYYEYYVIIKTYPDSSPDVRNGRVFSHCLMILKKDLLLIHDIGELFPFFSVEIDKSISLEPISFVIENGCKVTTKDVFQPRFNKVVQEFSKMTSDTGTIIWVGQEQYEVAVSKFWQMLSPFQKEVFNFGINFNPSEIPPEKLNFIVIPEGIETKFGNVEYHIIHKSDSVVLKGFFEQYLAGDEEASIRLKSFIEAIEANGITINDISTVSKGINTFEELNTVSDLKLLITLSNIVAKYSPIENQGIALKNLLIEKICLVAESTNEKDILLLKNVQIGSFKDSEIKLSGATNKWMDDFLFAEQGKRNKDYAFTITQVYSTELQNWWTKLFKKRVEDFISNINQINASIIWEWVTTDFKLLNILSSKINKSKESEAFFITAFYPLGEKAIYKSLKVFTIKKGWLKLHATILKSELDFSSAIVEQLKVDSDTNFFEGIEILLRRVAPQEIIKITVEHGDKRCISISGKLCKNDYSLLEKINIENSNWQEILLASVKNGNKVTDGIKEPTKVFFELFDALVSGKPVNNELLEAISLTDYVNILNYPHRNEIWRKLPYDLKSRFLERTSSALLEAVSKNTIVEIPTDDELSEYIISNAISTFLYFNNENIKAVLPIFNTYIRVPEYIIKDYILNYKGKLDIVDSTQLGKLISFRNFKESAYAINSKMHDNKNFKYALSECYHLLDFFTKAGIQLTGSISDVSVTKDQWWAAFTDIAIKLYNAGPVENKIWKQAGGEEYDLILNASGKVSWIAVLAKLRNGGFTDINVDKLLKAMQKDYPKNDELRTLKELWEKLLTQS